MSVLTAARSGIARAGATRSGYPILAGVIVKKYCLSGIARSGAIRSNYHSSRPFVSINGVQYATSRPVASQEVLDGSLVITDTLNETPNTATMTTRGFIPVVGQTVIVTLGSPNNLTREFAGQIISSQLRYVGTPGNYQHDLNLIDYTWGLNKRKVRKRYTSTTVAVIAADLVSTYASGYTVSVSAAMGVIAIDEITFTEQDLTACLSQLTKRAGGSWVCDYLKVIKLFITDTSETNPTILNTVHRTLSSLTMTRDLSQVLTRVYVEGGGSTALTDVAVGETILPVQTGGWYESTGGVVVSGPQRITYTGVQALVGGGLVGTGAAPSGAPLLALASGAVGIASGSHDYGVTFVTAAGESIVSPLATITTGNTPAPTTAPTAAIPTIGTGPEAGSHDYAVTYVTSSGETTAGPSVTRATALTADPVTAPTPGIPTVGTGVSDGNHDYAVTFVTAIGETLPSPISAQVMAGPLAAPASAPTASLGTIGTGPEAGSHDYAVTYVTSSGETTAGPRLTKVTDYTVSPASAPTASLGTIGTGPEAGSHNYGVTFVTATGETTAGPALTKVTDYTTPPAATGSGVATNVNAAGLYPQSNSYSVTFVTSAGETSATVLATGLVGSALSAPTMQPTFSAPTSSAGGALAAGGVYKWVYTFTDTFGHETAPSPASAPYTAPAAPNNYASWSAASPSAFGLYRVNIYRTIAGGSTYYLEYENQVPTNISIGSSLGAVVTDAAIVANRVLPAATPVPSTTANTLSNIPLGDANVTARKIYRTNGGGAPTATKTLVQTINDNTTTTWTDSAEQAVGAVEPSTNTAALRVNHLTAIPTGSSEVTSRKIYRTKIGGGTYFLLATIANNSTTTLADTTIDATLGAAAPSTNTAVLLVNNLTAIPIGPVPTTSRKLYRTAAGATQLKLLATLANNSTTTYTDTTIDVNLGANVPVTNTAAINVIPLTGIPTGDANVTSRKLYRRFGGAGLKLLATLADNTTTTYTDTVVNASLGAAVPVTSTAYLQRIALAAIPTGSAVVTSRKIYRTAAGATQLKLLTTLADNTTTTFTDTVTDASLGLNVPTTNTATANRVALSSIPVGAASVTSRKIYRTAAGATQLKLLTTIADNVTSTYTDAINDGSLGANVPTSDTSGLTQPAGNVLAGSTSLQVANIGPFPPSGWAVIGNGQQVIRYTGISGQVLTGIPASGPGAIVASIAFNSTVTSAPQLTGIPASGVGSILNLIKKGDEVNLFVQIDDLAAQTALAALITGDGIQEDTLQDRRLSRTEAVAKGTAWIQLRRDVHVTLHYQCRDINTRSGRTVRVNLGAPFNLTATDFLLQQVSEAAFTPVLNPTFTVTASSIRFTFDELIRSLRVPIHV